MRAERLDQDTRLSRVVIARVVELPLACARANGAGQMRAERVGGRALRVAVVHHLVEELVRQHRVFAKRILRRDAAVIFEDARDAVEELEDVGGGDVLARRRGVVQTASLGFVEGGRVGECRCGCGGARVVE